MKDISLFIAALLVLIFCPVLYFIGGWVTGYIIKWTFGLTLIRGLAYFDIAISADELPLLCGTLGVIGSFFKSSNFNK